MKKYVVYTRVSTTRQAESHLGIEAQQCAVDSYLRNNPGEVIATYEEHESGKLNERVKLAEAIRKCVQVKATLLIAKLDRLSRNASFIFQIRDAGIQIQACDLPELNTLTLGIFASLAQYERELISKRTCEALQAKKLRGEKLGNVENLINNKDKAAMARAKKNKLKILSNPNCREAYNIISTMLNAGAKWSMIRDRLQELGINTSTGLSNWQIIQVQRVYYQFHKI
ncbi:MAG: recombinase family protein [Bacteroidales bacterium]